MLNVCLNTRCYGSANDASDTSLSVKRLVSDTIYYNTCFFLRFFYSHGHGVCTSINHIDAQRYPDMLLDQDHVECKFILYIRSTLYIIPTIKPP